MREIKAKQLTFKFQSQGRLTCKLGNWRFVITEKHDEYRFCGYIVKAYLVGYPKAIYTDEFFSFCYALESLTFFMYKADESAERLCAQTEDRLFPADNENMA